MPDTFDHVAYLSQQIGPRPAGTEEEQQAALYITEQLQKDAGLPAVIEDFSGAGGTKLARVICCGLTVVAGVAAMFFSMLYIPALVIALISLIFFAAEAFEKPILSRVLSRGVSQNVVARYEPGYTAESGGSRRRKIVLVARYDSGKVRSDTKAPFISILPLLRWIHLGAMVFVPLYLLVRTTMFSSATGTAEIVLNVLLVVALLLVALPIFEAIAHKFAAYNEAANCNAAGVAVLLEVARRIGRGRVSEAELAARNEGVVLHGENAAHEEGLIPEGAELVYAANSVKAPELAPQSEAARLAAAKAAVAALTGKPVSNSFSSDISEHLVQVKEPPLPRPSDEDYQALRDETREAFVTITPEAVQEALLNKEQIEQSGETGEGAPDAEGVNNPPVIPLSEPASFASSASSEGVPDWFKKAQEKAKKPAENNGAIQRSRYAEALDAAMGDKEDSSSQSNEARDAEMAARLQSMRDDIMEVKVPQWQRTPEDVSTLEQAESEADLALSSDENAIAPTDAAAPFSQEEGNTTAMPPIDVSTLRLGDMPKINDVPLPSFLDPSKAQAEKLNERGEVVRTENRIDVTSATAEESAYPADYAYPQSEATAGVQSIDASAAAATQPRPISLPDIGISGKASLVEISKQRAPLAEAESSGKTAAKSLLTMLPSIDPAQPSGGESSRCNPEQDGEAVQRKDLRAVLPSLSGSITRQEDATVNAAGSFIPAGVTGSIAPIGDELLQDVDPEDIYVDDADDSAYDDELTETGAFAGAGYVEMPKSRARRFFDRFRSKKDKNMDGGSAQDWLDVNEEFDARSAGAARGGWESFREEGLDDGYTDDDFASKDYDEEAENRSSYASNTESSVFDDDDYEEEFSSGRQNRWNGGAFSRHRVGHAGELLAEEQETSIENLTADQQDADLSTELQQIYQFRNPDINTEVWFVALGSELVQQGGMQAFLSEHSQDLRGSIIIEIEALGVGDLCMIEREGTYRKAKASSRMKRYTKKASQATGLPIGSGSILWSDSASSVATKQGFQSMHLVGMDGPKPAFFAQGDDVLENIEEETLEANADFIMELLKNI